MTSVASVRFSLNENHVRSVGEFLCTFSKRSRVLSGQLHRNRIAWCQWIQVLRCFVVLLNLRILGNLLVTIHVSCKFRNQSARLNWKQHSVSKIQQRQLDVAAISIAFLTMFFTVPMMIQDTPPPPVDSTPMRRGTRTKKPPAHLADYQ